MSEKKSYQAWTISEEFWKAIKEEIPKKERDPQECPESKAQADAITEGSGGYILCVTNRLPMEDATP